MNPMVLSAIRHAVMVECLAQRALLIGRGKHFTLYQLDAASATTSEASEAGQTTVQSGDIIVVHHFLPTHIDNNIGYYVANELLPLLAAATDDYRRYTEQEIFERSVGAIVRSMDGDEGAAWQLFYANTLQRLSQSAAPDSSASPEGFIETFGAIYQHACHLIGEADVPVSTGQGLTLLDVATCFGFFPFFLGGAISPAGKTWGRIVGCDLNVALVNLARAYAAQQQFERTEFVMADILTDDISALRSRLQATSFDIVTAIHLLEHLEEAQMSRALANLWQLTGRRLIIAVPLEEEPDARFGHVQTFTREKLLALGQRIAGTCQYYEYHGGWLVIDRQPDHKIDHKIDRQDVLSQPSEPLPIITCLER